MSYPTKYRERTIEYRKEGNTLEETRQTFKVSIPTIRKWEKQQNEEGHLEKKPLARTHKKLDPKKSSAYIAEHPDSYLSEIAEVFSCTGTAVYKALKRLNITRKKRQSVTVSKTLKK